MAIISNNPTANDPVSWLEAVWSALQHWRENLLEEGDEVDDKDWDEITTSMAWITEELGYELDGNGDYVPLVDEPDPIGALARTHNEPDPEMEQKIRKLMPLVRRVYDEGSN